MIELFEHNQKAYDSAVAMLAETNKAAVIHPTGTGKSFIGFKLCEDHPDKMICWLSPSDYIYRTQLDNLAKAASGYQPQNVQFFTYAKLMNMSDEELLSIRPDYIVLDEFHRCGAREWGKGVSTLLEFYEDVPVLGLSATNVRYLDNRRDMAIELFDGNIASEMTLGEAIVRGILAAPKYVVSVYSYRQELEKYLQRVQHMPSRAVREKAEKYLEALRRALDKAEGLEDVFASHMTEPTGKYIVFCANFEHMREMMKKANAWFSKVHASPKIYSVYSLDPTASKSFLEFKADDDASRLRLLYCIDALNEGIHLDDISGVILIRPTVSPIIYKQQIGRALSANKAKSPVIFDIVNNFDNLYSINAIEEEMKAAINYYRFQGEGSNIVNESFTIAEEVKDWKQLFDGLSETLSATWEIMYSYAKRYYDEHGDLVPELKYKTEEGYSLGSWLNTQRMIRRGTADGFLSEEQIAKLDAIGMRWETKKDCSWNKNFAELLKYKEQYGNIDVNPRYKTDSGVALGRWISRLRMMYNAGIQKTVLTDERIAALNQLGMIWDKLDYIWESYYQALVVYYRENGSVNVPKNYRTDDGLALGAWLRKIKMNYRTGEGASLTENQKERLEMLGIDLSYAFSFEKQWEENYGKAKQYYKEHGNMDIPTGYVTEDGVALGQWVMRVRAAVKQKHVVLTEQMRQQLEDIGVFGSASEVVEFEQYYAVLTEYYNEHGNIQMSGKTVYGNLALGTWLLSKRGQYRKGILSEKERLALDALGMDWMTLKERQWEDSFSLAEKFYLEHGHLQVPYSFGKLNAWVNVQRTKHRQNALSDCQYQRLTAIGMVWEPDDAWDLHYAEAKDFYHQYGHLDIPAEYETEDGVRLGRWYRSRLKEYKSGILSEERAKLLEAIGIQKESVVKRNWMRNYALAKRFYEQNGNLSIEHSYVSDEGVKLGIWISDQREKYKRGGLTDEQIALLEAIQMHWNRFEAKWESYYLLAENYYKEHGNLGIPSTYETNEGVKLGSWLCGQKTKYKSNKLSKLQIDRLEKLGMIWSRS